MADACHPSGIVQDIGNKVWVYLRLQEGNLTPPFIPFLLTDFLHQFPDAHHHMVKGMSHLADFIAADDMVLGVHVPFRNFVHMFA